MWGFILYSFMYKLYPDKDKVKLVIESFMCKVEVKWLWNK